MTDPVLKATDVADLLRRRETPAALSPGFLPNGINAATSHSARIAPTRARRVGKAGILFLALLAAACGRSQPHVIREPVRVEVPVVVCPRLDPQLLEEVRVPEPPEPMTYGALVEWTADLLQVIARLTADRRAVASSLPARCVGASP